MRDWKRAKVDPRDSVRAAIGVINDAGVQIGLVVDEEGRLVGVVTDGDVRRGLLRGVSLEQPVVEVMNGKPFVLTQLADQDEAQAMMRFRRIRHVPVVDTDGMLVGLIVSDDLIERSFDNEVILMAGGLGSRLGKLTETTPKPLLPVGSKPILQTIIERFSSAGFKTFRIAVNYRAEQIIDHFGNGAEMGVTISYLRESKRLGTAGALALLRSAPDRPFFVMNADLLTKVDFAHMLRFHEEHDAFATVAVREYELQVPFGVMETSNGFVKAIEEKPIYHFFVNAGIYILSPRAAKYVTGEEMFDMPDLLAAAIADDRRVLTFPIHEVWVDIGQRSDLENANRIFAEDFAE